MIAWMSPVKCRLMSAAGSICARPPPVPPPLIPKTGPSEGSRRHTTARSPMCASPIPSATLVVVFPSPALVGVIALTRTSFAFASRPSSAARSILALSRPYIST